MSTISPETALVYTMVLISACDGRMTDSEIARMTFLVGGLPAFQGYDRGRLLSDSEACTAILEEEDGLDAVLGLIKEAVPDSHMDLVYTVACDVAAADGKLSQEELRVLEIMRYDLTIDRLVAAAIERSAAARRRTFAEG
ncbi:MAG: tellurite resistance TerB family protein [Rhodothalassiaceae bacterium]